MTYKTFWRSLDKDTLRLAVSYLAIIMVLSICFSVAFYHDSTRALGRQLPAPIDTQSPGYNYAFGLDRSGVNTFLRERYDEGRSELLHRLILLNALALLGGAGLSYFLARRSLEPIEASMAAQSRFVSDASHELRTPLTAIRARNEVSLRKKNLKVSEAKETIASNLDEIHKLELLTEGLLQLARSDTSLPHLGPVPVDKAVTEAINNVIGQAQAKQISIDDQSAKTKVWAQHEGLVQAITIILNNAVKYSPEKTKVTIQATADTHSVALSIADQGYGIRASDMPHIFERFYRADSSRSHTGASGYGLGLSIAKKLIVDQFGGHIDVKSTLGKGTTFTVRIPAAEKSLS